MKHFPLLHKTTVLLAVILLGCASMQARTLNEARQVAQSFFNKKHIVVKGELTNACQRGTHAPSASASQDYYIFNAGGAGDGYVIVSGDDRAIPVLGYSDNGTFDLNNIPPAMQEWLDLYAAEIASIDENTPYGEPTIALGADIRPMLTCNWGQGLPFNSLLPTTNNGKQAQVGCVATAMAQVMYYHKWPTAPTKPIASYTTESQGIEMNELPVINFDWSNMQDMYVPSATGASATAVAQLSLYCAQSLQMDFKDGTSSAATPDIPLALYEYFNYAPTCRYLNRANYTRNHWEEMLYSELAAKRPVVYRGSKMNGGGHAFVCDGYSNGLFHFNWGWGSASNGYFALSALSPNAQGTGSAEGNEGYILGQGIVIGVQPNGTGLQRPTNMTFTKLELPATTYTRTSTAANWNNVLIKGRFSNETGCTESFISGWALLQGTQFISIISDETNSIYWYNDLKHNYGRTSTFSLSFGSNLADGNYRIIPMSKLKNNGTWEYCEGYEVSYIDAMVSGNTLTLTAHCSSTSSLLNYTVNEITYNGNRRVGKDLQVIVNVTNQGNTTNDVCYMFVDGKANTVAITQVNKGESENLSFIYTPESVGSKTLTFSFNEDGSNPIATRTVTIEAMPAANLSMALTVPNTIITDDGKTLAGNSFTVVDNITNNLNTEYDEDIVAKICRITEINGSSFRGTAVCSQTKSLRLAGFGNEAMNFTFDGLITGQSYFIIFYYYSEGKLVRARSTDRYLMTGGSTETKGDVNGDGVVDISDINAIINIMIGKQTQTAAADVNGDGIIDVADMNATINIVVGK